MVCRRACMHLLVNIDVDDLAAAERFYVAAFGLTVGRRFGGGGVVELLGAGAPVYLLHKPAGSAALPGRETARDYARHWTPVHLDFVVDDVDATVARAVAAGAVLEHAPAPHEWGRAAQLADPWGHGLCVLAFSERGYDALLD